MSPAWFWCVGGAVYDGGAVYEVTPAGCLPGAFLVLRWTDYYGVDFFGKPASGMGATERRTSSLVGRN